MKRADRRQMMERLKWELAQELGIRLPVHGYGGELSTRDCGKLGSELRRRAKVIENHLRNSPP